jgi:quinol monooxygenase YgiN
MRLRWATAVWIGVARYLKGGRHALTLGIVATLNVKTGLEAEFERLAGELVQKVIGTEPGCQYFALFRGESAGVYHFVERYADSAALDFHRATVHSKTIGARIVRELLQESPKVLRMTLLHPRT